MSEEKNFTYLFGAGASAEVIPVVKNFGLEWIKFEGLLFKYGGVAEEFEKINHHFTEMITSHISFDTYAKKLSLQFEDKTLKSLKLHIALFFNWLQRNYMVRDKRYDLFFATLLKIEDRYSFPQNLKILSYNYDWQVELSILSFMNNASRFSNVQNQFKIYPDSHISSVLNRDDEYNMIKINGSALLYYSDWSNQIQFKEYKQSRNQIFRKIGNDEDEIPDIFSFYNDLKEKDLESAIWFSWEKNNIVSKTREKALLVASKTNVLTVIGYSFPTLNRVMDKRLLAAMPLQKVYIQAPSDSIKSIVQRFKALTNNREIDIEEVTEVDEFHIPFEFD